MPTAFHAVHQVAQPEGMPAADDFAFVTGTLPDPAAGQALVENLYLSVDPYMRECMNGVWELNAPLEGRSVGRVLASEDPRLAVGDLVFHRQGWRTHALVTADEVRVIRQAGGVPLSAYLSVLGGTGLSAYVALTRIARLQEGESLFVSAAAGGVGTAAGQLARILGAGRVIGSAGSAAKVRHLVEDLGFDAAFDYHDGPVTALLRQAAPDGVDACLENVGGDHLEAAIDTVRPHGRIVWCGAVSTYNDPEHPPAAPRNLYEVVGKSLRLEGFLVREYAHVQEEMEEALIPHIRSGRLVPDETVADGFDRVVDAFLGMLRGENTGKMIVRVGGE
ncbi:NADP-dependent oxidoreductase [Streptomyces sp. UNOB3_S3]|uniref:NADP-dependent oxidoreductase n=1 Tax=Streptomyces sp. UNOB3_S3 TaxID=2871682 RepID=UPI001E31787F|nr:NADP-dependent oxidoreductase [Streptomyces sp. UNOB3_S3]MCC3777950.1 NADP-dependent oxidoreductase [Streptomyces sp. UNOB3_S3]